MCTLFAKVSSIVSWVNEIIWFETKKIIGIERLILMEQKSSCQIWF